MPPFAVLFWITHCPRRAYKIFKLLKSPPDVKNIEPHVPFESEFSWWLYRPLSHGSFLYL